MPLAAHFFAKFHDRPVSGLHNARSGARSSAVDAANGSPNGSLNGKSGAGIVPAIEGVGRSISSLLLYQALARLGLLVKGLMFIAMGCFSGFVAIGLQGDCLNAYGVFIRLADGGVGQAVLALITLGFFGYALFKTTGAICDTDGKGWRPIGLIKRVSMLLRAAIYAGLGTLGLGIMLGGDRGDGSGDALARAVIASLMQHTHGEWLVLTAGAILMTVALLQFYMIHTAYVRRRLRLEVMRPSLFHAITCLARTGYLARGIVALGMGALMMSAGWHADPTTARGLGGTLRWLDEQTYVPYLLAPVSVGLVTYGIFEIFLTYYRRLCVTGPASAPVPVPVVAAAETPIPPPRRAAPMPRPRAATASLLNSWSWTPSPWFAYQQPHGGYDPAHDTRPAQLRAIGLAVGHGARTWPSRTSQPPSRPLLPTSASPTRATPRTHTRPTCP